MVQTTGHPVKVGRYPRLVPLDLVGDEEDEIQSGRIPSQGGVAADCIQNRLIGDAKNLPSQDDGELLVDDQREGLFLG